MHLVMIQYDNGTSNGVKDICLVRDLPRANKYVADLQARYPSYQNGTFSFKRVKYIK